MSSIRLQLLHTWEKILTPSFSRENITSSLTELYDICIYIRQSFKNSTSVLELSPPSKSLQMLSIVGKPRKYAVQHVCQLLKEANEVAAELHHHLAKQLLGKGMTLNHENQPYSSPGNPGKFGFG